MKNEIIFKEKQGETIILISKYYEVAKKLMILGEQVDIENNAFPGIIFELRNCLDHLMRVIQFKAGIRQIDTTELPEDYEDKNMEKSFGHVYRAVYDALDWVAFTIKERLVYELNDFSVETIREALPTYYSDLRPRLEAILTERIVALRMDKDVTAINEQNLLEYEKIVLELKEIFLKVINNKESLIEIDRKQKRASYWNLAWKIILAIISGGVITTLLKHVNIL